MEGQSSSSSGLFKRQPSASVEEGRTPAVNYATNNTDLEIDAGCENSSGGSGVSLLSAPDGNPMMMEAASQSSSVVVGDRSDNLNFFVYGHIALSVLFLVAGSSIVPVFAAAEDESWRTSNIPYQKTAAGDIILDFQLNKPLVDPPTVPSGSLIITSIVFPVLFVLLVNHFDFLSCQRIPLVRYPQMHELRASVCAVLVSIGLSEGVTQTLKLYVRRHRPCFYALCGFDPATLQCTAPLSKVHEANLSFPSGHSSLSFCAMTFLAYFLLGRLARMTGTTSLTMMIPGQQQRVAMKLYPYKPLLGVLAIVVPWSYSTFVATSRIVDNWHHPSDIIAGSLLGIACATIGYHAFYPPTTAAVNAGIPLSLQSQQQQQPSSS